MSATPDSTLANPEQRIADLERQLAEREAELTEREAELAEARERETATAEVLQVINASPGDLMPVLDAMLEKAMRLCEANYGHIYTFDGQQFHPAAIQGEAGYADWRRRLGPVRPISSGADASPLGRILQGERVVQVADATLTKAYRTLSRVKELIDTSGIRSVAAVALRKEDALLGVIVVYRREVRQFSDKQIALLQNFAFQAVIAMENARLITETREALEQQTATAEVLSVINSSPGNLAPVFDTILENAMRLCEAAIGELYTFEGDHFDPVALLGVPPAFAEFRRRNPPRSTPGTVTGRIVAGMDVVHVVDLTQEESYRTGDASRRALVDLGGARTGLGVALRKEGSLLGEFFIFRQEVRPFTDKQIALLQNFAAQAVIAMENARLITETREALEQQTATAEVLGVINSSPGDLAPVFNAILEKAHKLCDVEFGTLQLYDGEKFRILTRRGFPENVGESWREPYSVAPNSPLGALLKGEPLAEIPDVIAYQAQTPNPRAEAAIAVGIRGILFLPLRRDNLLLGVISAGRREAKPFQAKEIALLQNFAAQAVIAMENARLITETREALEQQTATAELLGVINSSPGDLSPVFDAMLERAMRLCGAAHGHLFTYDGESLHPAAMRGDPRYVEWTRHQIEQVGSIQPSPNAPLGRIIRGERVVHVADTHKDPVFLSVPRFREQTEIGGIRSTLAVALHKDDALLGTLSVYRQEVRPFTDKQIALVQNFAAQAVIAMENARLITETREALEQQTATAEVLRVINSSPSDLAPVFDAMLESALRLCGAAFGQLWTYDGDCFDMVAARGVPTEFSEFMRGPQRVNPRTAHGRMVAGERVVHIADLAAEELYRSGDPGRRATVDIAGARSLLGVPLLKDGNLLGVLIIYRQEVRPFTDKQIALLQNFAAQAVIAMENARLITETREALEQQTATAEVLGVINSSPGDLTPVFDSILEKAHSLCGAEHGALATFDGEYFRAVASRAPEPFGELLQLLRQPFRASAAGSAQRRLLQGERLIHIPDVRTVAPVTPIQHAALEAGIRTLLMVPLRQDDRMLGYITATRLEVRPFSDKQISLLQNFAAQAVIAMENARLLGELRQRTDEVAELNRGLEARVAEQVEELGRVGRLKRFLAPQLAELIVSQGDEKILESHRREIVVVFCDLRGYTAFTETAEPEEVLEFLRQYHGALGPLVSQFEGTLDQFSGDGIMVFFNDPVPCPDPAERAVKMAMAMREEAGKLIAAWRHDGCELGFGAGIAQGYATLGQIGFSDRSGYTAIGTVCNLASRLCAEAKDGQILLSSRVARAVEAVARLEDVGNLDLRGLRRPVAAFNVVQNSVADARPNLTIVASEPGA